MESAIISLVSVGLVIIASITMLINSLTSAETLSDSLREMEQQAEEIRRTEITSEPPGSYAGGIIDLMVENEGQSDLYEFDRWDILVTYQDGEVNYIVYTDDPVPDSNEWTLGGIYQSDNTTLPELFGPGTLNPGETAKLSINLDPEIAAGESGLIITSTENGVTARCVVSRP